MTASHAPDAPNLAQLPSSENKATSTLLPPRGRRLSSGESRRAVAAAGSLQRERRLRGLASDIRSLSLSLSLVSGRAIRRHSVHSKCGSHVSEPPPTLELWRFAPTAESPPPSQSCVAAPCG